MENNWCLKRHLVRQLSTESSTNKALKRRKGRHLPNPNSWRRNSSSLLHRSSFALNVIEKTSLQLEMHFDSWSKHDKARKASQLQQSYEMSCKLTWRRLVHSCPSCQVWARCKWWPMLLQWCTQSRACSINRLSIPQTHAWAAVAVVRKSHFYAGKSKSSALEMVSREICYA